MLSRKKIDALWNKALEASSADDGAGQCAIYNVAALKFARLVEAAAVDQAVSNYVRGVDRDTLQPCISVAALRARASSAAKAARENR